MHRIATLFLLGFAGLANAQEMGPELTVRAQGNADRVRLEFRTVEAQNQVCPLSVQSLSVDATQSSPDGVVVVGHIEFTAGVEPDAICLFVVGQQQGAITFARGAELPALAPGRYDLVINDTSYGVLQISADGARIVEAQDGV